MWTFDLKYAKLKEYDFRRNVKKLKNFKNKIRLFQHMKVKECTRRHGWKASA